MEKVQTLILGGGISGIAFSHFYNKNDYLLIEKTDRLGGLCKSFKVGESIFDYSGHFIHFKDKEIEEYTRKLVSKHATGEFKQYERRAGIALTDSEGRVDKIIDYPFQANIHQLDRDVFLRCLVDLWNAPLTRAREQDDLLGLVGAPTDFEDLLKRTLGNEITKIFFKPYNEKLYCTDLKNISADGMKRFIPRVLFNDVIENFKTQKEFGYNSTFLYSPTSGIQGLVDAFIKEKSISVSLNEEILDIDIHNKIVKTDKRTITYETLVNTLPLNLFTKLAHQTDVGLRSVDVNVYNFTYKGEASPTINNRCWVYVPDEHIQFYRVGYYSFMSSKPDTSIYVEVSTPSGMQDLAPSIEEIDKSLRKHGFIYDDAVIKDSQRLLMSPAYAIIEKDTDLKVSKYRTELEEHDIYLTGRYGLWTYCSIEDNIRWAKDLAAKLSTK